MRRRPAFPTGVVPAWLANLRISKPSPLHEVLQLLSLHVVLHLLNWNVVLRSVKVACGVCVNHLVLLLPIWCMVLQLLNWHKRLHNPVEGCRLYRLAPHCSAAPTYLVLKAVLQPQLTSLDPRGVFAVQCSDHLYLWQVSATAS